MKVDFQPSLMLTAWIAANVVRMSMDIRVHVTTIHDQINKQGETRGPTTHRGWTTTLSIAQCFEFHDKHGRNRRKERICFDHELVRDQSKQMRCGG